VVLATGPDLATQITDPAFGTGSTGSAFALGPSLAAELEEATIDDLGIVIHRLSLRHWGSSPFSFWNHSLSRLGFISLQVLLRLKPLKRCYGNFGSLVTRIQVLDVPKDLVEVDRKEALEGVEGVLELHLENCSDSPGHLLRPAHPPTPHSLHPLR